MKIWFFSSRHSEKNFPDPQFAIGRVAARSAEDIKNYLDKVKQYDQARLAPQTIEDKYWMKRVLHLSGGSKTFEIEAIKKQYGERFVFEHILDEAEALIIPPELEEAFAQKPQAKDYFLNLSRSDKRNILQWLVLAKRSETRQNRINEIVTLAAEKQKPKQFRTQ